MPLIPPADSSPVDWKEVEESLTENLGLDEAPLLLDDSSGGKVCQGRHYRTTAGDVFVKVNTGDIGLDMFVGELESLKLIFATKTIPCANAIYVDSLPAGGAMLVEHRLNITDKGPTDWRLLGELLARLHIANSTMNGSTQTKYLQGDVKEVTKFGFDVITYYGYVKQERHWCSEWLDYFITSKIQPQMDLLHTQYNDVEAMALWEELQPKLPCLFENIQVVPSLLHGDFWRGNIAQLTDTPVVYDPASFYGHDEYDLAFAAISEFPEDFFDAYHELNPRQDGWENRRELYTLFNYINHWNHFGAKYRVTSLELFKNLLKNISSL